MASRGVNKVILIGNLGGDPEIRYTTSGTAVATITLATSESWKDQQGQQHERTEWHRCVLYRRQAEIAGEYLKKGSKVYFEGQLRTREWQDQQGQKRYTTEIIVNEMQMLDSRQSGAGHANSGAQSVAWQRAPQQPAQSAPPHRPPSSSATNNEPPMDFDDDIPFGYIGINCRSLLFAI